jgi:hypothetical protein
MTTVVLNATPNSTTLCPEHCTVRFYGINYFLPELEDSEFNALFDRIIDDAADLDERAEGWTAAEFVDKKASFQKQQAQAFYNLEMLELEGKRREKLMALEAN